MIETIRMQFACISENRRRLKQTLAGMLAELEKRGMKKEFLLSLGRGRYARCLYAVRVCERKLKDGRLLLKEEYSINLPHPGASLNVVRLQADERTLPELGAALEELNNALLSATAALWIQYALIGKGK